MEGRLGTAPERSSLVLLAARLILEEALEGEVRDEIGRERYERADGEARGYRNGYRPGQMKTAEGMVEFSAPQVRDTPEPFVSAIRKNLAGRTQALEDLAVELYARGLSTRDLEDAFTDESGRRLLSRAAVSEITERLWAEYEAFTKRDLSEYRIVYLYVDGIAERLRAGQPREAVIGAWGIGADGRKVLLHLMAGSKEIPRRCGHSSRTCGHAGLAIRCLSCPTAHQASSAPSRSASRVRHVSAAWHTGCAISR
jgi:putative transposase